MNHAPKRRHRPLPFKVGVGVEPEDLVDEPTIRSIKRHPQRIMVGVRWFLVALIVWFVLSLAQNDHIDWDTVGHYVKDGKILRGLLVTLEITVVSTILSILIGVVVAIMAISGDRVLRAVAQAYVALFRAVPLILQILLWGNLALLFPRLSIGIPFTDISTPSVDTNSVLTLFLASVLALSLQTGAYMAEIVRGGILGVGDGQMAAATALGLTRAQSLRRVILPQAARIALPPAGNQTIVLLKETSLISVIGGGDILTVAQNISVTTYQTIELLFAAAFWYIVAVGGISLFQAQIERKIRRGHVHKTS